MDRRKSIKSMFLGGAAAGLVVHGCKTEIESIAVKKKYSYNYGRTPKEKEQILKLEDDQFFSENELGTIAVLCDLILPANGEFGGATDVGVPAFIEFIAKDIPEIQTTLRGGLMWLDYKTHTEFGTQFKETSELHQKEVLDTIAYYDPEVLSEERPFEIHFFDLMRNLTLTGYYTTKTGIEELGYKGNRPNVWDGVPQDVLEQHGVSYEPEWIAKCMDQSASAIIAEWDEEGNLLT